MKVIDSSISLNVNNLILIIIIICELNVWFFDKISAICNGQCCDSEIEDELRHQAKEDFHNQIHHHSRSLLGLLATTADALRGKFFPY